MGAMTGSIYAEYLKTRGSVIPYILIAGALFIGLLVFMAHYMDIHNVAGIGSNPWERILHATFGFFSYFLMAPILILVISLQAHSEQRAAGWKMLYTLPVKRYMHYLSKVLMILLLYTFLIFGLVLITAVSAYLLGLIYPELEVFYYSIPLKTLFIFSLRAGLAGLGVIGFHYFISYRFKNVFVSLGIGIFSYIIGFIMVAGNVKAALYNPYALAMINDDFDMIRYKHVKYFSGEWLTNAESNSVFIFVFFVFLGYVLERKRQIVN